MHIHLRGSYEVNVLDLINPRYTFWISQGILNNILIRPYIEFESDIFTCIAWHDFMAVSPISQAKLASIRQTVTLESAFQNFGFLFLIA